MSGKEIVTGRQDLPKLLYPRDVAQILGISVKTIHKLVRDGKLGCVKVTTRDRRFTQEQVQHVGFRSEWSDRDRIFQNRQESEGDLSV